MSLRKIIFLVLATVMMLGCMTVTAFADTQTPSGIGITELPETPEANTTYYLTQDITATTQWFVHAAGVTLDLNGHTLNLTPSNMNKQIAMRVGNDTSKNLNIVGGLTIIDSSADKTGVVTSNDPTWYSIKVVSGSQLTIDGARVNLNMWGTSSGVLGTLVLKDGAVIEKFFWNEDGGKIVCTGEVTIQGFATEESSTFEIASEDTVITTTVDKVNLNDYDTYLCVGNATYIPASFLSHMRSDKANCVVVRDVVTENAASMDGVLYMWTSGRETRR